MQKDQRAEAVPSAPNMKPLRTKHDYLCQLVDAKNKSFRPLTDKEKALGFLGWHERGYLPHCDYPWLVQLVTFRLGDSMPAWRRGEWEHLLQIEDGRGKRTKLEAYLDRGLGGCWLRDPRGAELVEDTLLHFQGQRYELLAWCVMPNHVHALVHVWQTPLWKMIQNWKVHVEADVRRYRLLERRARPGREQVSDLNTPRRCSALQSFWQREYWDTFMRDEEQERKAIHYIESNPVKAKLCRAPAEWKFSGARFRGRYGELELPTMVPGSKSQDD
jgi:REP element-mobilizing transposase RayT